MVHEQAIKLIEKTIEKMERCYETDGIELRQRQAVIDEQEQRMRQVWDEIKDLKNTWRILTGVNGEEENGE